MSEYYTIRFSDPSKTSDVKIPNKSANISDTSLILVGKGYPAYGEKIAENFLHLLENFASAIPPENPIEGQLWYDTSDANNKVLRVMDGTATSTRWPSATGIYQQNTDPKTSASAALKSGDIWVDTGSNQLKIYNSNDWTVVGPTLAAGGQKNGPEAVALEDTTNPPVTHYVIKNWVDGEVISIISKDTFIPRVAIDGFTTISPGVTISTSYGRLNSTAKAALALEISNFSYSADRFLRKDDGTVGQKITGKVVYETPNNQAQAQGRDGVVVYVNGTVATQYVQFYKRSDDAVILNNVDGGKIKFIARSGTTLKTPVTIESAQVGINNASPTAALDVIGNVKVSNTLLASTATISLDLSVGHNASIGQNLRVTGNTTSTGVLTVGSESGSGTIILPNKHDVYNIGSPTNYFNRLYVSVIASTSTGTTLYGTVKGSASRLETPVTFKLEGQVTATSFAFSGTETNVVFTATIAKSAVTGQPRGSTGTDNLTILAVDTSTTAVIPGVQQISRKDFLADISFPGMITAYGGVSAPTGWLLCQGTTLSTSTYANLFAAIGYIYGGTGSSFKIPNMTTSTFVTTGTNTGTYVPYIIKT